MKLKTRLKWNGQIYNIITVNLGNVNMYEAMNDRKIKLL